MKIRHTIAHLAHHQQRRYGSRELFHHWQDGQWRDFVINGEMNSADRLFDMNPAGQSINQPNMTQSDPKHELAESVAIFMQGLQHKQEQIKMARINTASGWDILLPSLQAKS